MQPDTPAPGVWDSPQNILVILAHPDDPEFFCGATLARWARAGHTVSYYLLTCGDKGYNDRTRVEDISSDDLCALRHEEQAAAAKVIGAQAVYFLERPDGYLVPDMELRREVVRLICLARSRFHAAVFPGPAAATGLRDVARPAAARRAFPHHGAAARDDHRLLHAG